MPRHPAEGGLGSTGVPPVPAGVPPGGVRGAGTPHSAHATRRVDDSAGRQPRQAGRLCYPSCGAPFAMLITGDLSIGHLLSHGLAADILKFGPDQKGLAAVTDPAASDKRAVAVNLSTESGSVILASIKKPLAPGLYNFAPRFRLLLPAEYDRSRLKLTLSFLVDGKPVAQKPLSWLHFNERAGAYTEFEQQISFTKPSAPVSRAFMVHRSAAGRRETASGHARQGADDRRSRAQSRGERQEELRFARRHRQRLAGGPGGPLEQHHLPRRARGPHDNLAGQHDARDREGLA